MDTLAQACGLGLVTRSELERGMVRSAFRGRPDQQVVTLRGRVVAIVREAPPGSAASHDRPLLETLSAHDLGPHVLRSWDGRLWTEPLPGRPLAALGERQERAEPVDLTDVCVALGTALARVHRLPTGALRCSATAWPSLPREEWPPHEASLGAEVRHAVSANPDLQVAIEAVSRRWSQRYWTLGGFEPCDIIVDGRAGRRVRFGEVEAAGLGSADWDIAACLASIALAAGPGTLTDPHAASVEWLGGHFWNSYRRAGGPGQVHPQVQAMHAIAAAWRAAERGASAELVRAWLIRAHRLATRRRADAAAA
jgi:hypothetical protein